MAPNKTNSYGNYHSCQSVLYYSTCILKHFFFFLKIRRKPTSPPMRNNEFNSHSLMQWYTCTHESYFCQGTSIYSCNFKVFFIYTWFIVCELTRPRIAYCPSVLPQSSYDLTQTVRTGRNLWEMMGQHSVILCLFRHLRLWLIKWLLS